MCPTCEFWIGTRWKSFQKCTCEAPVRSGIQARACDDSQSRLPSGSASSSLRFGLLSKSVQVGSVFQNTLARLWSVSLVKVFRTHGCAVTRAALQLVLRVVVSFFCSHGRWQELLANRNARITSLLCDVLQMQESLVITVRCCQACKLLCSCA